MAKWFTDNLTACEYFVSDTLLISKYKVARDIFDRMLAKGIKIHGAVLNNDISAVEEFLKNKTDTNVSTKAAEQHCIRQPHTIAQLYRRFCHSPDADANISDEVLKLTPLRYADRTKSLMVMDILLQNGANPDDLYLLDVTVKGRKENRKASWGCASKGHRKVLEFMLSCGTEFNAGLEVPEKTQVEKHASSHFLNLLSSGCHKVSYRNEG